MCYSYSVNFKGESVSSLMTLVSIPDFITKYAARGFDHPRLPAIISQNGLHMVNMDWGLIPAWVNTQEEALQISHKTLNARVETLDQKVSFKDNYYEHRCILPASGFFETQHLNGKKYPHYVSLKKGIFLFAGIYATWQNKQSFAILTQAANDFMAHIHNHKKRQPIMLNPQQAQDWLMGNTAHQDLPNIPSSHLQAHMVGPYIHAKTNYDQAKTIEPYIYPELSQQHLF
jgi:putative SOS response-associated peptidase YedK